MKSLIINSIIGKLPAASQTGQIFVAPFERPSSAFIPIILHFLTTFQIFIDLIESEYYQLKPK